MKRKIFASLFMSILLAGQANAGCLTGAVVGGVAGHLAGHHALIGAAAGCAVGHEMAVHKKRRRAAVRAERRAGYQARRG